VPGTGDAAPAVAGAVLPAAGADPRVRHNVTVLGVTSGWANLAMQTWNPVVPLLLERHGAPAFGVAAAYAASNLGGAAFQYAGGLLADRLGSRWLVAVPTFASAALWLVMALSGSWQVMAAAYVAVQVVFGIQTPAWTTLIADSTPLVRRTAAFTSYNFLVAPAYILGPLAGGLLVLPFLSPPVYIGATAASFLVVGVARLRWLGEPRGAVASRRPAHRPAGGAVAAMRAAILGSATRRRLLGVSMGSASVVALTITGPFLSLVAHGLDGLAARQIDLLFAVGALGMIAASLVAERLARRVGEPATLAIALVATAAAVAAFTLRAALWDATLVFVLLFAGYQLGVIAIGSLRAEWAAGQDIGAAIGGTAAAAGLVVFGAVALGGALQGVLGPGGPLVLAAVLALLTAGLAVLPLPAAPEGAGAPR